MPAIFLCFRAWPKPAGTVVLEAMAMSRPVLAVKRGGPAESVASEAGFLIDPRNPEYLVEQIKEVFLEVLANRELIVAKGAGARKVVEDKFDWPKKGEAIDENLRAGAGQAGLDQLGVATGPPASRLIPRAAGC